MPRLLVFAACDNVLLGNDNNVSLITLLNQITLNIAEDAPDPLPADSTVPIRWFVYSEWEIAPEERGLGFEQRMQLFAGESQDAKIETIAAFMTKPDKSRHRMIGQLQGFPLLPEGIHRLKLSIRPSGGDEWTPAGDYPFEVVYRKAAAHDATQVAQ